MRKRPTAERPSASVAVGHAGTVLLIEAASGRVLWERALSEFPAGRPCEGQPVAVRLVGDAVIAAAMGHVFALSKEDGSLLWQVNRRARGDGIVSLATEAD